jgi:RNA polymerase sigma-19 factor, ECF subfamily
MPSANKTAFPEIVEMYSSRLILVVFNITKSRQAAEDIVQETFVILWQKQTEIISGNLGGWLYKVASHLAYKHLRKESRRRYVSHSLWKDKTGHYYDVEERLINKESFAHLDKVIDHLPEKQKVVYRLSREKGLKRDEIACHLNISPNTVKVHLLRALQFIREHVAVICLFLGFFIFNNLFFKGGNTMKVPVDLYKVKHSNDIKNREPFSQIQQHLGNTGYQYRDCSIRHYRPPGV